MKLIFSLHKMLQSRRYPRELLFFLSYISFAPTRSSMPIHVGNRFKYAEVLGFPDQRNQRLAGAVTLRLWLDC
jgi:D-alanyl-lipoteichoic acid acyltransferase DltB (MBOAT superfamily)